MPEQQLKDREVEEYLAQKGLTPAQIDRVLNDYRTGYAAIDYGNAYEWLDTQAERLTANRRTSTSSTYENVARGVDERADEGETAFRAVAEMARQAAARRRQAAQDLTYKGSRIDHGPIMDPDALANSVASGVWMDGDGNYIDPLTGQRSDTPVENADPNSIWHAIKGQRFNMGSLAMPAYTHEQVTGLEYGRFARRRRPGIAHASADTMERAGRRESYDIPGGMEPIQARRFITPSQALNLLSGMSPDYLSQLQLQMWEAGLFSEGRRPQWGRADVATREAFRNLFIEASLQPDKNIAAILADMGLNRRESNPAPPGSPGAGGLTLPNFEPVVENEEKMRQDIDKVAQETLGRFLPPEQRDALVARLREREVSLQRTQYDRDVATARQQSPGEGVPAPNDIDSFLAALGAQESGGDYGAVNRGSGARGRYQIMPANWPEWSRRAGLPPGSRQTPENQEIVARQIASDYYAQFGNWRDVAVAWYAGPGNVGSRYSTRAQRGGPSINSYANSVMGRMAGYRRAGVPGQGAAGSTIGGNIYSPLEQFDPVAEAQAAIRAADPAGWQATEFANRANEFFSALGSALGGT
jgi:hypothetical protein